MIESIEKLLAEVARRWNEQGIQVEPPVSEAVLREFESRFHVQCPDDFATYLKTLGGMKDGMWDQHLIRFWPLREIRPVDDTPRHAGWFVFADYSISAHEYTIRFVTSDRSEVALLSGAEPRTIAATFTEFLALYLTDATALF